MALDIGSVGFRLQASLMSDPGRVISCTQLAAAVWSESVRVDERTIDINIGRLRKTAFAALEQETRHIQPFTALCLG